MTDKNLIELDRELGPYLSSLLGNLGRVERCQALCWYATGLLLCGERKSMSPIAARLCQDPAQENAVRQRLQQAVTQADWDAAIVYHALSKTLMPGIGILTCAAGATYHGAHMVKDALSGNLREALIQAALKLLGEGGTAALSLRAAAQLAGVSHAAPYRHFRDKIGYGRVMVPRDGIEPPTLRFSIACSTN